MGAIQAVHSDCHGNQALARLSLKFCYWQNFKAFVLFRQALESWRTKKQIRKGPSF